MKRPLLTILLVFAILHGLHAQQVDTVRIVSYNVLNFVGDGAGERVDYFRTITEEIDPDIIAIQEVVDRSGSEVFLRQVLDWGEFNPSEWRDGNDTDNMLYFKEDRFQYIGMEIINPEILREIHMWELALLENEDAPHLFIAACHLVASPGRGNEELRRQEALALVEMIQEEHPDDYVVLAGDLNCYYSNEPAYQILMSDSTLFDPIHTPGSWNNERRFAAIHTQSTRTEQFGGGAHGGMDDRFDQILMSRHFNRFGREWGYIEETYTAFGNDGRHFNLSIIENGNDAVSEEVADALHEASDHIPVYVDLVYWDRDIDLAIALSEGWSMISTCVPPVDEDVTVIWEEVVGRENLAILKNQAGRFYLPEHDFNNIPGWMVGQGYQVKMTGEDELVFAGEPVAEDTPIALEEGWSLVSYYPALNIDAVAAFDNVTDVLAIAKDERGRFYLPEQEFSNMGELSRGKGYQVKMTEAVDLVWNTGLNVVAGIQPASEPKRYSPVPPTGRNMSLLISGLSGYGSTPVELAAFNQAGVCIGAARLEGTAPWGMAVWGDDPTTVVTDGAIKGENLRFKASVGSDEAPVDVQVLSGSASYRTDSFAHITLDSGSLPMAFGLAAYPNPFNDATKLSFNLPQQRRVSLAVLDVMGREVVKLADGLLDSGQHEFAWQGSKMPSGLYFARLMSGGESRLVKMTMIR